MNDVLKNTLLDAFSAETPDLRARILAACQNETQVADTPTTATSRVNATQKTAHEPRSSFSIFKAIATVTACAILFVSGLILGNDPLPTPTVDSVNALVYLDVNPSLELSLDQNKRVLSCTAANADAETILDGMDLNGVELQTALNALIGSMYVNGYLAAQENSILVTVDKKTSENTAEMLADITEHINAYFKNSEMSCSIIAQTVTADETLKARASQNGVSVGKMHLIDKIIEGADDLDENNCSDLSSMSIKELNLIYSLERDDGETGGTGRDDELISGNVGGYVEKGAALTAVLAHLRATLDDVQSYRVMALPTYQGEKHVYYIVTLQLKTDGTVYKYEVDCETGEVYREYTGFPSAGPNNGTESPEHGAGGEPNDGTGDTGDTETPPDKTPNEKPTAPHRALENETAYFRSAL